MITMAKPQARFFILRNCFLLLSLMWITFSRETSQALTWRDEFSSSENIDSYDLFYNLALGSFHPFQRLEGWNAGSGPQVSPFLEVGDGSLGEFGPSTFSDFGDIQGSTITINTDQHYPVQVTSFYLPLGWTLRGEGTNPLDIRSQSDIIVLGIIDCSGEAGEEMNADNSISAQGGQSHCGKGQGGRGGSTLLEAANGSAGGSSLVGGRGANTANLAPAADNVGATGGGGGGAYRQTGTPAEDGYDSNEVTWVSKGSNFPDNAFSETGGGSGGGGGSVYFDPADLANHSSGGGGGAGGGAIFLSAVRDIEIRGSVLAKGGNGGGTSSTLRGGAGGGGGGGSIAVWAGRDLIFTGAISASNGLGGESGVDAADLPLGDNPNRSDGGDGSVGRTWITDKDKCGTGICTSTEVPSTLLGDEGRVLSQLKVYTIISKVIDLENSQPLFESASVTGHVGSGSSVAIQLATGSTPDFDPTALWKDVSGLGGEKLDRYLRFKIILDNQDAVDPTTIEAIQIDYQGYQQNEFNFVSNCGRLNSGSSSGSASFWWALFSLLPLIVLVKLRFRPIG